MMQWTFKAAKVVGPEKAEMIALSQEQQKRIPVYKEALLKARSSQVPDPPFSNYFVKGSIVMPIVPKLNSALPAGNIEYGLCQALHCEETAVAVWRAAHGKYYTGYPVLGFYGKNERIGPPTCCGNCRDILLDAFGPELEIVAGKSDGGTAIVSKLADLLCERYDKFDWKQKYPEAFSRLMERTARHGQKFVCDPYAPENVHPERRYHLSLEGIKDTYFGARDIMCDYHPIYAGRDAVRQAIRNFDPFINQVIVSCEILPGMTPNTAPHVMYKDRQHLLELNLQAELLDHSKRDPKVYLFTYELKEPKKRLPSNLELKLEIIGAWTTSLKTWLPFPFTARNFGPAYLKLLEKYYRDRER